MKSLRTVTKTKMHLSTSQSFASLLGRIKLKFNPMFDYLVQLVFVQRFLLLGSPSPPFPRLLQQPQPSFHSSCHLKRRHLPPSAFLALGQQQAPALGRLLARRLWPQRPKVGPALRCLRHQLLPLLARPKSLATDHEPLPLVPAGHRPAADGSLGLLQARHCSSHLPLARQLRRFDLALAHPG